MDGKITVLEKKAFKCVSVAINVNIQVILITRKAAKLLAVLVKIQNIQSFSKMCRVLKPGKLMCIIQKYEPIIPGGVSKSVKMSSNYIWVYLDHQMRDFICLNIEK